MGSNWQLLTYFVLMFPFISKLSIFFSICCKMLRSTKIKGKLAWNGSNGLPQWWTNTGVYMMERFVLALLWRRPLSYRNQCIDLQSKSMDWFLYDRVLHHERVKCVNMGKNKVWILFALEPFSAEFLSPYSCIRKYLIQEKM